MDERETGWTACLRTTCQHCLACSPSLRDLSKLPEFSVATPDDNKKHFEWKKKRRPDLIFFKNYYYYLHLPFLSQTIIMVLKTKYNKVKIFKFFSHEFVYIYKSKIYTYI